MEFSLEVFNETATLCKFDDIYSLYLKNGHSFALLNNSTKSFHETFTSLCVERTICTREKEEFFSEENGLMSK